MIDNIVIETFNLQYTSHYNYRPENKWEQLEDFSVKIKGLKSRKNENKTNLEDK